jgi:hypothetical protein
VRSDWMMPRSAQTAAVMSSGVTSAQGGRDKAVALAVAGAHHLLEIVRDGLRRRG